MRSEDAVARWIRGTGLFITSISSLIALNILGLQAYAYLKVGEWSPLGILDYLGPILKWEWALYPEDWLGLYGLINALNAGVTVFLVGLLIGVVLMSFESR